MLGLKRIGGERVGKGNYWNLSTGERVHIEETGILPGDASKTYYRFHPAVVLVAGPALGLAYAIFLPFIGIAMAVAVLSKKLFVGVTNRVWQGAAFSWKPSEAYLAGKKRKAGKTDEKTAEDVDEAGKK